MLRMFPLRGAMRAAAARGATGTFSRGTVRAFGSRAMAVRAGGHLMHPAAAASASASVFPVGAAASSLADAPRLVRWSHSAAPSHATDGAERVLALLGAVEQRDVQPGAASEALDDLFALSQSEEVCWEIVRQRGVRTLLDVVMKRVGADGGAGGDVPVALGVLWSMSSFRDVTRHVLDEGAAQAISSCVLAFPDNAEVARVSCEVLGNLALDTESGECVGTEGGVASAVFALRGHADNHEVQAASLFALCQMASTDDDAAQLMAENGAGRLVWDAAQQHVEHDAVLCNAWITLRQLSGLLSWEQHAPIDDVTLVRGVCEALAHRQDTMGADVVEAGLSLLATRECTDAFWAVLAELRMPERVTYWMQTHADVPGVQAACCDMVANMCSHEMGEVVLSGDSHTVSTLLHTVDAHADDRDVMEAALAALWNTCTDANVDAMHAHGIVEKTLDAWEQWQDDADLAYCVVGALQQFVRTEAHALDAIEQGAAEVVCLTLREQPEHEVLQLQGLGLLCKLAVAGEDAAATCVREGAVPIALRALSVHAASPYVTRDALHLLRHACSRKAVAEVDEFELFKRIPAAVDRARELHGAAEPDIGVLCAELLHFLHELRGARRERRATAAADAHEDTTTTPMSP